MLIKLIMLAVMSVPNQGQFATDKVSIIVEIKSNIYTYKVTNLGNDTIMQFEIEPHACYNFFAPDNWEFEESDGLFRAWTESKFYGIKTGKTAEFSMRVSSKGAVLALAPARLKLASGQNIIIPDVWTPRAGQKATSSL